MLCVSVQPGCDLLHLLEKQQESGLVFQWGRVGGGGVWGGGGVNLQKEVTAGCLANSDRAQ